MEVTLREKHALWEANLVACIEFKTGDKMEWNSCAALEPWVLLCKHLPHERDSNFFLFWE